MSDPLLLGLDTGGTYTDAVLFSETHGVIAKAKALTTRHDLAVGISEAASAVLLEAGAPAASIGLVSLSTTLATNALVEGQGGRVALVMIGFGRDDLARDGLAQAVGDAPVVFLPGGHDVHGHETPLDTEPLTACIDALADHVSAFAVAGYFAVRNPEHELRVRDLIRARTDLPVTCSHELSSKLGGPRRALTTFLNARLIGMIDRLLHATRSFLAEKEIVAPLMVVRGDGALISADQASLRPIETILSGPAASLVGARYLTGAANGVVSDIGGTTTDVAILDDGQPRLDADGAVVGGFRTMVEAVAMHTYGLGGDSEVRIEEGGLEAGLTLGPRRCVPLSLAAMLHGDAVIEPLERQVRAAQPGRLDGRFACRSGMPDRFAAGLQQNERQLYEAMTMIPQPLDRLLTATSQRATLDRLVARGLAHIVAFTPSDAMHVLGRQAQWNAPAAQLGAVLLARRRDGAGRVIAADAEAMALLISARLTLQSAHAVLEACLADDAARSDRSFTPMIEPATSMTIDRALRRTPGTVRFALSLDRPLIGLGASAPVHYPAIAAMLGAESLIPDHADVANAVGAVVGQIRSHADVVVTSPDEGLFVVGGAGETMRFRDEARALDHARRTASQRAEAAAREAGAEAVRVTVAETLTAPEIEGLRKFVEARIVATATGRPRIAVAHSFHSGQNDRH